ncbi:MAG: membrane protein insertion efficiency factor YidD [Candidatus Alcyoniella australis]|nr:membrane protein insertion efficiency factor YidD [Candidatus Alcyoniella australis]
MIKRLLATPIKLYKLCVSPYLGNNCRYLPTCSEYALEALELHPAHTALWLAVKRLTRCHPWGGHGYDPVPKP